MKLKPWTGPELDRGEIVKIFHKTTKIRYSGIVMKPFTEQYNADDEYVTYLDVFIPEVGSSHRATEDEYEGRLEGAACYQLAEKYNTGLVARRNDVIEIAVQGTNRVFIRTVKVFTKVNGLIPVYIAESLDKDLHRLHRICNNQIRRVLTPEEVTHFMLCN